MGSAENGSDERRAWYRLTAAEQAALLACGIQRTWGPGEILALQGSPPSSMFVIFQGFVKITAANYRGDNAPLAARGPAEIVGEMAPISGVPRIATIQAIDEVRALVVPRDRLLALLEQMPRISAELFRSAVFRLQQSDRLRLESGGSLIPQRLAAVLLELALQYDPDWEVADEIQLPETQEDLASFARVSRSTLIRGLDELKKLGVLETARHRVTIIRPDMLRDLAAGNPPT
jgi:CRP/FNR family transcriptional regulator, cyclic AMP receptor protein